MCGGTIRTDTTTSIEVPNFSTTGQKICVWKVISAGNLLAYSIDSLNIASDENENCTKNYVEVAEVFQVNKLIFGEVNRSQNHKRYCGTKFNYTLVNTASDQLLITLNSTRNIGRASQKYFKMFFRTIHHGRLTFLTALRSLRVGNLCDLQVVRCAYILKTQALSHLTLYISVHVA